MNRVPTPLRILCSAAVLWAATVGCGTGEDTPRHASTDIVTESSIDPRGVKQPSDATVTSIGLASSMAYEADQDLVRVFALAKDQDGNELFFFNKYNFTAILDPTGRPRAIDHDAPDYALTTSLGTIYEEDRVVALVLDVSGSMATTVPTGGTRLAASQAAAVDFVDGMVEGDQTSLVSFSGAAELNQPLTGDTDLLKAKIRALTTQNSTNIGAAIQEAVKSVGTRPGKRAVILLTDGGDNHDPKSWFTSSTTNPDPKAWIGDLASTRWQAVLAAQAQKLPVYTIAFGLDPETEDGANAIYDLATVAERTGGKAFTAASPSELTAVLQEQIPSEVAAQDPLTTLMLTFANPATAPVGVDSWKVPVLVRLDFENANGRLSASTTGAYKIK